MSPVQNCDRGSCTHASNGVPQTLVNAVGGGSRLGGNITQGSAVELTSENSHAEAKHYR